MSKILLSVLVSLSFININYCQWVQVGSVPTSRLNGVKFLDLNTGITVGVNGIWRSTNSGINWTQTLAVNGISLNAVSFSGSSGFAVGDSNNTHAYIYRTTDGGLTWLRQFVSNNTAYYGVWSVTNNTAYVVGYAGIILKTTTAGNSWVNQTNTMWPYDLYGIMMADATTGFAVGSLNHETYMATINGGGYWGNYLYIPNNSLKAVFYLNIYNILAAGTNGRIRRTTNLGASWTFPVSGTTQQLNDIKFADQLTGYIAGNSGVILRSVDSGLSWQSQTSSTSLNLRGLSLINSSTGWAVGQNGIVIAQGIPTIVTPNENELPKEIKLHQNYPNPFNPVTDIIFENPYEMYIEIKIFDILGKEVQILVNKDFKPGVHKVSWNANKFGSGIYFYRLYAIQRSGETYIITRRMTLIK